VLGKEEGVVEGADVGDVLGRKLVVGSLLGDWLGK
jgi:hypothetical protein